MPPFREIGQGGIYCLLIDQPEKHKLGRGCRDLASCQVSLNLLLKIVSEEKSKMS